MSITQAAADYYLAGQAAPSVIRDEPTDPEVGRIVDRMHHHRVHSTSGWSHADLPELTPEQALHLAEVAS